MIAVPGTHRERRMNDVRGWCGYRASLPEAGGDLHAFGDAVSRAPLGLVVDVAAFIGSVNVYEVGLAVTGDLLEDVRFEWERGPYRLSVEDSRLVMERLAALEPVVAASEALYHATGELDTSSDQSIVAYHAAERVWGEAMRAHFDTTTRPVTGDSL